MPLDLGVEVAAHGVEAPCVEASAICLMVFTFPRDIAYSRSPTASRALSGSRNSLAAIPELTEQHHDFAHGKCVLDFGAEDIPRFAQVLCVLTHTGMAAINATLAELSQEGVPLDLGMRQLNEALPVHARHRVHHRKGYFHVLPRHRRAVSPDRGWLSM